MPTIVFSVSATNPNWQVSPVSLAPGETAAVRAEGKWGVIDPHNRGVNGAGGDGVPAHGDYFMTDPAGEGCLVMKDGVGNMYRWATDDQVITVHQPGTLFFGCNDDRSPNFPGHAGFADNFGNLTVYITITVSPPGEAGEKS